MPHPQLLAENDAQRTCAPRSLPAPCNERRRAGRQGRAAARHRGPALLPNGRVQGRSAGGGGAHPVEPSERLLPQRGGGRGGRQQELVDTQPFDELVRRRLLRPAAAVLGMLHSTPLTLAVRRRSRAPTRCWWSGLAQTAPRRSSPRTRASSAAWPRRSPSRATRTSSRRPTS